ncbi:54S ribosomal protein L40 [Yarrowia sp. C11]|nr:54S ribosomal protein L40 [Yarrowia sp. E02]KAG5369917.1 54S ribosomal protein L40 [Yarrowia sp. C11]
MRPTRTVLKARFIQDPKTIYPRIRVDRVMRNHFKRAPPHQVAMAEFSVPEWERFTKDSEWHFMPGDKVQVLTGPDKGKVSQIISRHEEGNSYLVDGVNGTQSFPIPPNLLQEGQTTHMIEFPNPLKQHELRLVAQRPEEDGSTTEVAIAAVECVGTYYDPAYKRVLPRRVMANDHKTEVPWPAPMEPVEHVEGSTEREVARERTHWVTSLVKPPFPMGALPDIRNVHHKRFKRFSEREVDLLTAPKPFIPKGTPELFARPQHKKPENKLTAEMEAFIGSVMQKHAEAQMGKHERVKNLKYK